MNAQERSAMTKCRICGPMGQYRCNCSRRSSPKVKAHLKAVSLKGAQKSAYARRVKSWNRWVQMVKGKSLREAWRHVWLQGYNAGYERRRRGERVTETR